MDYVTLRTGESATVGGGNSLADCTYDLPCCARDGRYHAPDCKTDAFARFGITVRPVGTPTRGRFVAIAEGLLFEPDGGA